MVLEMATESIKQEEGLAPPAPGSSVSPTSSHAGLPTPNSTAPKSSQTPSPTSTSNGPTSASRRPPRKSTLTQQQKNQKRQRATQDQLTTLEMEFNKNPTPTATVRERIAEEINMTERSVQIWFQNRRAKIKMMAKKSLETGEDINDMPESMRQYLHLQAMESGKSFGYFGGRTGLMPYGHQAALGGDQGGQGKVLIHHLTCRSLAIGSWTRVGQNTMDLIIFYSPDKCTMTYYINSEQAGYKIEYPFAYIKSIFLDTTEGENGGITIELLNPPFFFMDSSAANGGFFACGDFTEDQQASHVMTHRLGGNPKVLSGQLAKLISLEAFMHRHSPPNPILEPFHPTLSMSAPVSPTARPSSQPNFAQPHVGLFQETQWGIAHGAMMMRGPGHKRQRSRSVPGPIDFQTMQLFQQQPPSFHITQHESQTPSHNTQLFSPIPQQPNGLLGPLGPGLRIDTQATFGSLDMRQYPLSATTAPSPSDYSSPNFFASQGPDNGSVPAASFTPYSGTFSPLVNPSNLGVPPPSISPLSFNHPDPAIVGESPPTSMAPIYESSAVSDDGNSLSDMYQPGKNQITLPMHPHSPYVENQAELEINQFMDLKHFDVDPASLSPESVHQHA
ncbi:hypothetical protein QBC34DRAFT_47103 [Podospora aff. communis PSN243]|uniref:Homeobox domain-containing protein n=1 Tax=Podospora aff. communis PSN243 TaxID=3040156 RepID=A0AAV9GW76_9PEZI|nr:hypothetical protein QBC34DRAFT_47103 [Podospora aff. communis PSN243]